MKSETGLMYEPYWTERRLHRSLWMCSNVVTVFLLILTFVNVDATPMVGKDSMTGPFKVLRIIPNDERELAILGELWRNASHFDLDFWHDPSRVYSPVDVMVSPTKYREFQAYLHDQNLHSTVTVPDVQKLIDSKQSPASASKVSGSFSRRYKDSGHADNSFISRYHSYEEVQQYMADLERRFPSRAKVLTIGRTHEGRSIQLLKVGTPIDENSGTSKRAFWIDGGIHAREWIAPTTAIYFIHQLVTNYDKDRVMKQYVDNIDWYILPMANPDGYEYSRTSTFPRVRLWRKNRSPCTSGTTECCQGVDLNRNFGFHWGTVGASHDICDEVYAGSGAFSEPETAAIRDFINARPGRFDGFVTLHSYSQIWMYPFGHKVKTYPEDVDDLKSVAAIGKRALEVSYGTKYLVGTGADTLYPASGGSDDWAKDQAKIKYVYLLELRPEDHVFDGFVLSESQIIPTAKETWDGIKVVADAVLQWNDINPLNKIKTTGRPTHESASACKDSERECRRWSSFGGCTIWPDLKDRCPKSCRICDPDRKDQILSFPCVDHIDGCQSWKDSNLCNWVIERCRFTCGMCL